MSAACHVMPCHVIHVSPMSGAKALRDLSLGQSGGVSGDKEPLLPVSHQSNDPRAPHSFPDSPTPLAAQDHPAQHLCSPFLLPWSQDRTLLKGQDPTHETKTQRASVSPLLLLPRNLSTPQSRAGAGEWRDFPLSSPETKTLGVG